MESKELPPAPDDMAESTHERLIREATHWVVRLTGGEGSAAEREEFRRWRDQSPAHAAALAQVRQQWLLLGDVLERPARKPRAVGFGVFRLAAMAAIMVLFAAQLIYMGFQNYGHDYVTARGERRTLVLADGTRLMMGGSTAIDINYSNRERTITLARGVAFFDVVHNAAQPFSVIAGSGEIRDIGTAFSVERRGTGGIVVVERGEVQVSAGKPAASAVSLEPNQSVTFGRNDAGKIQSTDAAVNLSWTQGHVILINSSLPEALAQISPFYKGRLILLSDRRREQRINAVIDLNNIDEWLRALEKSSAARMWRFGDVVLIR